jgi:hypothetical protein
MTITTNGTNVSRGRLPAPRRDRRGALAALALLLILVGALGSALVAYRSGARVDVLVARTDIPAGREFTASDFRVARVSADSANVVEAAASDAFAGSYATTRIPEGTLVNNQMFRVGGDVVPRGAQLVGMVVDPTRRTTQRPAEGDVVRVYYVSQDGQPIGNMAPGDTVVQAARVMQVGGGGGDALSLTLLVRDDTAGLLAELAAAQSLAVAVLPDDTRPLVDIVTE